jgi:excinuclease ABC subunit A
MADKYGFDLKTPIEQIPEEALDEILYGSEDSLPVKNQSLGISNYSVTFDGVVEAILMQQDEEAPAESQRWARQFIKTEVCPDCQGARLKKESLYYRIHGKNIAELSAMDIVELVLG